MDSFNELSYYSLFDIAEKARWKMTDLPWASFDKSKVTPELVSLIKTITIGECTTFNATRAFMDLFAEDLDFTQWIAVWLYEETKHPQALVRWLACAGEPMSEQEQLDARIITPMTQSQVEMLTFNIVSEIVASTLYQSFAKRVEEPLLKEIMISLGKDEARHSVGFEHYCKQYIENADDPEKEKLTCLRAAWVFMQDDSFVQHPVYITLNRVKEQASDDMVDRARQHITSRISKAIGVPIAGPEEFNAVYQEMRKRYKQSRQSSALNTDAVRSV